MDDGEFEFVYHYNIKQSLIFFDHFIRCMLLHVREKCCHSLFIRPFTKPEIEEIHS